MAIGNRQPDRNPRTSINVKKIGRTAAIHKGIDYFVDLTVFYTGFIALSLFWLHERTRDYNKLISQIEKLENTNTKLEKDLAMVEGEKVEGVEGNSTYIK